MFLKKVTALALVTLFPLAVTFVNSADQFSSVDRLGVALCVLVALGLQTLIAILLNRVATVQSLFLSLCAALNIYSANLIFNEALITAQWWIMVAMLAVIGFVFFTLLNAFAEYHKLGWPLLGMVGLLTLVYIPVQFALNSPVTVLAQMSQRQTDQTSAENIRLLTFEERPNVYLIAFDSLQPKVLTRKYMGIEAAPYHAPLAQFRRFENFFAERVPSRPALNRLVALDDAYFRSKEPKRAYKLLFQGIEPSPLFEIFKHNGYQTNTLYNSHYFGKEKGPHVDQYLINRAELGVCEFLSPHQQALSFFSYCKAAPLVKGLPGEGPAEKLSPLDFLLSEMRGRLASDIPNVFAAYIYSPGHTSASFNYKRATDIEEYKAFYLESSLKTEQWLNDLVDFIKTEDPTGILYIMGDHGPWLSRDLEFEGNETFYIQDRHGVFGGVYPKDRCAQSFETPYSDVYVTVSDVTHMILRCLSGGQEASRRLNPRDAIYTTPSTKLLGRFEDYIYE
ncbi:hypothetical protein [Algirhabdus cladophorae]|uniref:hypothetical protein n=1 Tax=Algirhabdus cladophorae TaxID=3377108 RepID=UPI003B8474AE